MSYQLLVLDIDGTVTNSEKQVTPKTKEAILHLQEQGVHVVLASGRPPEGIYPIAQELGFDQYGGYVIAFSGAKIMDYKTRQCVFEKNLSPHLPARLWEDALKHEVGLITHRDGVIVAGTQINQYMELESRLTNMPMEYHEDFGKYVDFGVNECLIMADPEVLDEVEPIFECKYFHEAQLFRSESFLIEVAPKNVDKAYGLKHLLEILNIPREEMVCCGDSCNDIRMLEFAGLGVAMKNASDNVKNVADYVTECDHNHDGIAEVVERFFLSGRTEI